MIIRVELRDYTGVLRFQFPTHSKLRDYGGCCNGTGRKIACVLATSERPFYHFIDCITECRPIFGVSGNDPLRRSVVLVTGICTSSSWIEAGRILMTNRVGTTHDLSIRLRSFSGFFQVVALFSDSVSLQKFSGRI